jgi:hypothetical protein
MTDLVHCHVEHPGSHAFTRRLNDGLWRFTRDVMSYALRVEAYALRMHDQFPSFGLTGEAEEPALGRSPSVLYF